MAYKSFGKDIPQAEIWPLISKQNRFGIVSSTTHLMALHAIGQGLNAVIIQARHPLQVLRLCRDSGLRVILNQSPQPGAPTGHYTVLVDIDDKNVIVHDPALGPFRTMPHAELMRLWQPQSSVSEITGNVLIGIAANPSPIPSCEFCQTAIPPAVVCPRCKQQVVLSPAAVLGCIRDRCIARLWNYVACPACDFVFNENTKSTASIPWEITTAQRPPALVVPDLEKTFAQLDQFCAHMLGIPGAADYPDLKAQVNFIQANKTALKLAQAEEIAAINARIDILAAVTVEAKQKAEARRKEEEERNAPAAPLDPAVLGRALLRNLGLE
jgi:hypothetical protein